MPTPPVTINIGNTGFMLLCASLVMLMTPGLAFFYGGLVQRNCAAALGAGQLNPTLGGSWKWTHAKEALIESYNSRYIPDVENDPHDLRRVQNTRLFHTVKIPLLR